MTAIFPETLQPYAGLIVGAATALVIFIIGWIAAKWVHLICLRMARRSSMDEALSRFLASLAQYAVLAFAVIAALSKVGVQTTSLVALLGAAGLAVGLALQGNLSNFASGVMLLLFRPFTIDDRVNAGGKDGKVSEIGLFATTLHTPRNEKVIIPNGAITSNAIVNYTTEGKLRGAIAVGVAYGTDLDRAIEVVIAACRGNDKVLDDPAPSVNFAGFGASSLDLEVRPWSTSDDNLAMLHEVRLAIYNALDEAGIEIPFDQVVVHRAA
jgi:small conductance mechanosensitive channel